MDGLSRLGFEWDMTPQAGVAPAGVRMVEPEGPRQARANKARAMPVFPPQGRSSIIPRAYDSSRPAISIRRGRTSSSRNSFETLDDGPPQLIDMS